VSADCVHEEILKSHGIKLSDGKIAETTFISRVFGGYLCNTLTCSECKYSSQTFNHFLDLSLDINSGIATVRDSIRAFTKPEKLSAGNEWKCEKCNKRVCASKQLRVSAPPSVLVIHLKRFSPFGAMFGKINKPVTFDLVLELPYVDLSCQEKGTAIFSFSSVIIVNACPFCHRKCFEGQEIQSDWSCGASRWQCTLWALCCIRQGMKSRPSLLGHGLLVYNVLT
jgi:ubiquitin C-terminal hydrolase